MNKENWIKHMEDEGIVRPTRGGDKLTWQETIKAHKNADCQDCKARAKTRKSNRYARERHEALSSLGLKRVVGNLGGVYYE